MKKLYWMWTDRTTTPEEICKNVGSGWTPIIKSLIEDLLKTNWDGGIYQVKEKLGGLRFYINATPEQFKLIMAAEAKSFKVCEECGDKGKTKELGGHYYKTLCERCLKCQERKSGKGSRRKS